MDVWDIAIRVLVAGILGGVIGLDRELEGHSAGLRTNILVAASAAVFADVSINGFAELQGYDPSRVASNIVSGIGFLGAGAIFAMGGRPRGLTTAAALWASAAVGLAMGVGRWQTAVTLTVTAIFALVALSHLSDWLLATRRRGVRDLYLVVPDASRIDPIQNHLREHDVNIQQLSMVELGAHIGVDLVLLGREDDIAAALSTLSEIEPVLFASDEKGISDAV